MFKKYDKFTWWTPKYIPRCTLYFDKPMTKLQIIWETKSIHLTYLKSCFAILRELSKLPPEVLKEMNDKIKQDQQGGER